MRVETSRRPDKAKAGGRGTRTGRAEAEAVARDERECQAKAEAQQKATEGKKHNPLQASRHCSMPHRSLNTARMEAVAEGAARAEREPGEGRSGDGGREASPDFFSRSPVCSGYRSRSQETRVRKVRSSSSASSWIKSLPMPSLELCCFDFLHLPLM